MENEKPNMATTLEPISTGKESVEAKNPLQAYFRKPAIYVKLPSEGKFNTPDEIDLPGGTGEIPVYPMTAKDEILMRTPDSLMNGATTVDVIQSCCPNIKNAWKLSALDIDLILISIRIATYGETTEIKGVCPKCNSENTFELDLRTIVEQTSNPVFQEDLEVANGLHIKFKPLTYETATKEALKSFEQQRMIQSVSNAEVSEEERLEKFRDAFVRLTVYSVGILSETIMAINLPDGTKVTDREQIAEFVANADRATFTEIKGHLERTKDSTTVKPIQFECAGDTDTEGKHTPCDNKWEQNFTIDNSTFFG